MKNKYKRILIIEVNWLGDVLFSTPFIRSVREKFKDAHIACMIAPRTREVLEHNPRVNEIIIYDEKGSHRGIFGKMRLIKELRKKNFDTAFLLHRSTTRALLTFLAGIKTRIGYATKKRAFLLTHPVEASDYGEHKVEYFLRIAKEAGCDTKSKNYEFFITDTERKYIGSTLAENGIKANDLVVVMNPGANWIPKRWPTWYFAELGDRLIKDYNAKVVISGAKNDSGLVLQIESAMKERPVNLTGKTNLKQLAALMERANFVISGDTGPTHIAVAMKSNVIAIFGPTSLAFTGPYGGGNYKILQKNTCRETPCYEIDCLKEECMESVTVDSVMEAFKEMHAKWQR